MIKKYIKFVVVGFSAILGSALLWFLVDKIDLDLWISQAVVMCLVVIFSYYGHKNYTFKV